MNLTPEQIERRVELELGLLRPLKAVAPPPDVLLRVRRAVEEEARRLRIGGRPARLARWSVGVAAALAMAAGLSRGPLIERLAPDPFDSFDAWARALEDSGSLIDNGFAVSEDQSDAEEALDEWLQGLGTPPGSGS